jgi:hypothetical protein
MPRRVLTYTFDMERTEVKKTLSEEVKGRFGGIPWGGRGGGEGGGGSGARGEGRTRVRACVRACVHAPFDLPPIA